MFTVLCKSPLDEEWASRDSEIEVAAGCRSNYSGTNGSTSRNGERWHQYDVADFDEAVLMKERLMGITGVLVTVREK